MAAPCADAARAGHALSRRDVVRGGALVLAAALLPRGAGAAAEAARVTAWVRIGSDSRITLIASQSEMGQGTSTTLARLLADELSVGLDQVSIEFAPFDPAYRDPVYEWMFTGNSQSISSFYEVMRRMGAAAREMLLAAAAERLNVPPDSLDTADGVIRHRATNRALAFGEVAAEAARRSMPSDPRPLADLPPAGRAAQRWDIPGKVDGSAKFGIDVSLPGMLLAAVRCAPRFGGRLAQHDAATIKQRPGVVAAVELPNGLAVVAKTYWQARRALDEATLTWTEDGSTLTSGDALPPLYAERLESGPFFTHLNKALPPAQTDAGAQTLAATYEIPFQAHATMEPINCTARVADGRCDVWAPTQGVEMAHAVAMQVSGLPSERVTIHRTMIGGGFGRRLLADFVKQAVLVAMAVNAPVKLIWSREEELTHDFYRPAMLHRISGALDRSGALVSLAHRVVSPSHMLYILPRRLFPQLPDWTAPASPPVKIDAMAVEGLIDIPYDVPAQVVEQHRLELDVPVSVWRTTGHGANNFVLESFIDELAAAARQDPLAFRRPLIARDARALGVLDLVADKSGWTAPPPAGTARGVALAKAFGGYAAAVAEVSVSGSSIKVRRLTFAVDCGRVLDPAIATSNILGGAVWGLSAMRTQIGFERGAVVQQNFDTFEPLHLSEAPHCEVHFVASAGKPGGTGELGPVPVPAAVCSAIFAACGKRLRALPLAAAGFSFA